MVPMTSVHITAFEFPLATQVKETLMFALPTRAVSNVPCLPADVDKWTVPHLLSKPSDLDKVDVLLAAMADTKTAKMPEAAAKAKVKADAKKASTSAGKKQPASKKKNKKAGAAGAKQQDSAKRGRPGEDKDPEDFCAEVDDGFGNVRPTVLGDDMINAINYTVEKLPQKYRREISMRYALSLGILFALDSKLDLAGVKKISVWTKARKHIKSYLNRVHSLAARLSDPDKPAALLNVADGGGGEGDEDEEEEDELEVWKQFASLFRNNVDKQIIAFMEDNMPNANGNSA